MFFFFNDTATTEIYTLSLHDALPISTIFSESLHGDINRVAVQQEGSLAQAVALTCGAAYRSEEHTSELQSHSDLVCRLLLEKKKKDANRTLRATEPCDAAGFRSGRIA